MMYQNPLSAAAWKARLDACKNIRRQLLHAWSLNVDYRRGKPFTAESDVDRVNVNLDWALTKAKHAQLFSQVPNVILTPKQEQFKPVIPAFAKSINDGLTKSRVGAAVDEAVLDAINASGIGWVLVGYEARTEAVDVPAVDPLTAQMLTDAGQTPPTTQATRITSQRFVTERGSPSDLLWPVEFTGSDFDDAPWIGRSGRMFWAEAVRQFGLKDGDREAVCGVERVRNLREGVDDSQEGAADIAADVDYDEIFYRQTRFDADAKYHDAIQRLVFVHGKDEPVIDEPWNGQEFDPQTGAYLGSCRYPIRVLTLSYISDDAIPPSDTAIGRPQVQEIVRSRTLIIQQQETSKPLRTFDVNRVDPAVQVNLMKGTWQGMIPIQGSQSPFTEVARANYPKDDHDADRIAKQDLSEQWSLGANQMGQFSSGERSATEAGVIQRNNDSRIGYERARVAKFFVGIAEVYSGLYALYGAQGQFKMLAGEFSYSIRPDSTVLLDASTRLTQLSTFLNLTAKSGYVNVQPILEEMAALAGVEPSVIQAPPPAQPEPPNVSLRLSGEDLLNPFSVAMLLKSGQGPSPQELEAAKLLLLSLAEAPQQRAPSSATDGPAQPGGAHPEWTPMPRVTKRIDEPGG